MLPAWVLFASRVQCKIAIASSDLLFSSLHGNLYQGPPDRCTILQMGPAIIPFFPLGTGKKRSLGCEWVLNFCLGLVKGCFPLVQGIKPCFFATHQSPNQVNCVTGGCSEQSWEVITDPRMPRFGIKSNHFSNLI